MLNRRCGWQIHQDHCSTRPEIQILGFEIGFVHWSEPVENRHGATELEKAIAKIVVGCRWRIGIERSVSRNQIQIAVCVHGRRPSSHPNATLAASISSR